MLIIKSYNMFLELIIAALKAKFANFGATDATITRIATKLADSVTEESQVQTVVDNYTLDKFIQSETDSRVKEANKLAIQNYESKHGLKDGQKIENPTPTPTPAPPADEMPDWAKKFQEQLMNLSNTVIGQQQAQTKEQLKAQVLTKIGTKVPKAFLDVITFDIDDQSKVDETVESVINKYTEMKQGLVNEKVIFDKPTNSSPSLEVADADVEAYLDNKFPKTEN